MLTSAMIRKLQELSPDVSDRVVYATFDHEGRIVSLIPEDQIVRGGTYPTYSLERPAPRELDQGRYVFTVFPDLHSAMLTPPGHEQGWIFPYIVVDGDPIE